MSSSLPSSFRALAWSNVAAQSAEQIGLAAAPLIAVLALGAGPGETGMLAAVQTLPFLLLSFPAGIMADRMPRRILMAAAEAFRAVALLSLPLLAMLALLSIPMLAILGFAAATGTVVFSVAAPALVPSLVPRDLLARANGQLELARSVAYAAGPALAGSLVGWFGASQTFALAAALSILAVLCLIRVPEAPRSRPAQPHIWRDLKEVAAFAWNHPHLRPILLTAVAWNLAWFVLQAAYVPYAVHVLGLTASGIGTSMATYGIGMIVGALLAPRLVGRLTFGAAILVGPLVSVAAAFAMAGTIWVPSGFLAALSFFLFGAGPILWTISQTTLRQTVTPIALLGRVSALVMTATAGARPIGAVLGGAIGAAFGLQACIAVAAIGFVIQLLIIASSPVSKLAALPEPIAEPVM
ncbi:MFS transporter [Microvirga puerhi]|uniref:MFS transporter n=1 Tax=Microvirga puerhi TaxID=2876078 RepID=A0ABS7VPJ9_9HYPH|nr:MFS transporter [Microvirga puerhi]MBZ6077477.1 MFS transporter [Microvirga puerhi]